MKQLHALLLTLSFLTASISGVHAETISSANTTVVYPVNGTLNEVLAAKEVRRYVYPPQPDDFEYYLESGDTQFPVTASSPSPIYQTVLVLRPVGS